MATPVALTRVRHEMLDMGGGIKLQLSVAAPLSKMPPLFALYILDPEPELFALAAAHMYGRYGYDDDDSPEASVMRRCVLVGVGHDPALFHAGPHGWKVPNLRELRRRHFLRNQGNFLYMVSNAVPRAEPMLGLAGITRERRALLGCSLSSLLALRTVLRPSVPSAASGDVFGCVVAGSPSLPLCPQLLDEAMAAASAASATPSERPPPTQAECHAVHVLLIVGEREATCTNDAAEIEQLRARLGLGAEAPMGNGIPVAAEAMASLLRKLGHPVEDVVVVAGEGHDSLKPCLVSRGMGWLEKCWSAIAT